MEMLAQGRGVERGSGAWATLAARTGAEGRQTLQ